MVTNHKPRVSGDDPALWRRIRVVPFDVVIDEPDTTLPDRLALELPRALAWTVDGYREYELRGLAAPDGVTKRTKEYQTASDHVGRFLEERTISSPHAYVRAREFFTAWSAWCRATGEDAGTEVTFSEAMARHGMEQKRRSSGMVYVGIGLAAKKSA